MIHILRGVRVVVCDFRQCFSTYHDSRLSVPDAKSAAAAREQARAKGWMTVTAPKVDRQLDVCPACAKKRLMAAIAETRGIRPDQLFGIS